MLIKCSATMVRFFFFFFPMPTTRVACAAVLTTPYGSCCAYCAVLCHPAHATHFGPLCSLCAVLNTCVLYVCVCLCVGPEVVDGKGRRPVETQNGGMVTYGNTW